MIATQVAKTSNYRWLVFSLLGLAYLLVFFHRNCPAVVALDLMKDLHAGPALLGDLAAAYFFSYALMQLPAGLLADSWGPRRTVTGFFLLAAFASVLFARSQSVSVAIVARVLVGVGVSMVFVPTMKILTRWFRKEEFAVMSGLLLGMGGLGMLVAAAPLAYLSEAVGWRDSFLGIAAVTVALAALIWLLVRDSPEEMSLPPLVVSPQGASQPAIGLREGLGLVSRSRAFWLLAVWVFFTGAIYFSFGGLWGGPYLMQVYGLTKIQVGGILSMLAVGMIIGCPISTWLSEKVFRTRKKMFILSSTLLLVLEALLLGFPGKFSVSMLYVWCFLFAIGGGALSIIAFTATKELFPLEIAGTATGLINIFPFMGAAVMQPVVGLAVQILQAPGGIDTAQAYGRAFLVYPLVTIIALVLSICIPETYASKADQ